MVCRAAENADIISNLPVHIRVLILSYLPIRDIVRTGALSKTWRHRWAEVPILAFDANCCSASWENNYLNESRALVRVIDSVLLLHTGKLEVFKLEGIEPLNDIDRWILNVSRKSVKEFVLDVVRIGKYNLPSSLYDCSSLITLTLLNCSLKRPSYSVRLERLKCLCLLDVAFAEDAFDSLISSCPSLENLTLFSYQLFDNLQIKAPNLHSINLDGRFNNVTFGCTMDKLSDIFIANDLESHSIGPSAFFESGLAEFFTDLPGIQRLGVAGSFVKYLAFGSIPVSLPFQLKDVHHIDISMDFGATKDCLAALCLLNSSPNLTELKLSSSEAGDAADPGEWRDGSTQYQKFHKLRSVEIIKALGTTAELEFMELLLANSPVLEKMEIIPRQEIGFDFVLRLLKFKRASSEAEIIFDAWWAVF